VSTNNKNTKQEGASAPTELNNEVLTSNKNAKHNKEALMNINNAQQESVNEQQ
jgi:hypothetical protein